MGVPTTSLLIRTVATPRYGAQSNYFPNLAAHYYVSNTIQRKKLTGLSLLARNSPKDFCETLTRFLNTQSISETFFMMIKLGQTIFDERHVEVVANYAARGIDETEVVKAVVTNNGVDFFKSSVNSMPDLTRAERLAGFSVAASHGRCGFVRLERDPKMANHRAQLRPGLKSLLNKMSESDQTKARQYLEVFGMSEMANA